MVLVGQFRQGDVRLEQVETYLHDGVDVDGIFGRASVMLLHDVGQVAGGNIREFSCLRVSGCQNADKHWACTLFYRVTRVPGG